MPLECCADRSLCHSRGCSPERKLFFGRHCRPFLWASKNRRPTNQSMNHAIFYPAPVFTAVCTFCIRGKHRVANGIPLYPTLGGAAINFLKLPMGLPLQSVKQIEGCSEIQHLRNCGSDVRSNRGPARWYRPVQSVHLNGGTLAALTQAEPAVSCSSGEIFYGYVYQYQHIIIERPA